MEILQWFIRPQIESRAPNPSWSHLHTSGKFWLIFSLIFCHGRRRNSSRREVQSGSGWDLFWDSDCMYCTSQVPAVVWLGGKFGIMLSFPWCKEWGMRCGDLSGSFHSSVSSCMSVSSDDLACLMVSLQMQLNRSHIWVHRQLFFFFFFF